MLRIIKMFIMTKTVDDCDDLEADILNDKLDDKPDTELNNKLDTLSRLQDSYQFLSSRKKFLG